MSGFVGRAIIEDYKPGEFMLVRPLVYDALNGQRFIVPSGFITDFASVPKLVQLLPGFEVNGDSRRPAILHDYLYCSHILTRAESDQMLYEALRSVGVRPSLAWAFYAGVRAGGWTYWSRRKNGLDLSDFVPIGGSDG